MNKEPKKKPLIQFRPVTAAIIWILGATVCFFVIDDIGLSILIATFCASFALFDFGGHLDGHHTSMFDDFGGGGGD